MTDQRPVEVAGPALAEILFGWCGPMWRYRDPWGEWVQGEPPDGCPICTACTPADAAFGTVKTYQGET